MFNLYIGFSLTANHLQSPRSLFLDDNPRDSLSSRRPSFNASIMNNSLERGPSLSSPFYNGNTTFGGANTAGFQRRGRTLFNSTNEVSKKRALLILLSGRRKRYESEFKAQ